MLNNPCCAATCVQVKSEVRRLKGIPSLVSMLDHPNKEVHHSACGALKNISYGRDQDNKIAIKNCDGVPALVRLLRKTHNQDLTDTITGIKIEMQGSKVVFITKKKWTCLDYYFWNFPRNLVEPFIPWLCKNGDRRPRLTRYSRWSDCSSLWLGTREQRRRRKLQTTPSGMGDCLDQQCWLPKVLKWSVAARQKDLMEEERLMFKRYVIVVLTCPFPQKECEFRAQWGQAKAEGVHRAGGFPHVHCPVTDQPHRRG